ncbi:MAG TPA: hypothetical protein VFI19_14230, partial [Nocardioides sp.]|nr:hypothetical protein [Nocardioides sp.]
MALLVGRAATVALAAGAVLGLAVPPATAEVVVFTEDTDTVRIQTHDEGDPAVNVNCTDDEANVNDASALPAVACTDLAFVSVEAAGGSTTVNLGGVTQLAFPGLLRTTV